MTSVSINQVKLLDSPSPSTWRQVMVTHLVAVLLPQLRASALALRLIGDYDPLFAVATVRVLARTGGEAGKARLREAMARETRVTVRLAMQQVLGPPVGGLR